MVARSGQQEGGDPAGGEDEADGDDDEKGLRRHISLVTSPTEAGVVGLATRLRDTAFKRTLAELSDEGKLDVERKSYSKPGALPPVVAGRG